MATCNKMVINPLQLYSGIFNEQSNANLLHSKPAEERYRSQGPRLLQGFVLVR